MRALYSIVYALGFLLATPYWLIRGIINPLYLKTLKRRLLGPGKILPRLDGRPRVWVWAMSLGEVLAARELIREMERDGHEVIVSATTLAGLTMARANWPQRVILPSPLDFGFSARRFLEMTQPDRLVLVETDVWPRILMEMKKKSSPCALVSARLSPRSFKYYKKIRFFWSRVLKYFDSIVAQTPEDRDKFLTLGANPDSVFVGGNLKFDQPPPPGAAADAAEGADGPKGKLLSKAGWPDGRYLVAGSLHPGEDSLVLEVFRELEPKFPGLKLLLAPRNREKFAQAYRLAEESFPGQAARRSAPSPQDKKAKVFILDTFGELENFYALAELALIGKSWPGRHEGGGHNPLEAALWGKMVLSGPIIHNFKWIYSALTEAGGAIIVDKEEVAGKIAALLGDPTTLAKGGEAGKNFVAQHRGAVQATWNIINNNNLNNNGNINNDRNINNNNANNNGDTNNNNDNKPSEIR
jgi:3-deoxy-D-manno-octulosonic-acid transferase